MKRRKQETRAVSPVRGIATLAAESIDRDARTVEMTFYSGAPVLRASLFDDPHELEFEVTRKAAKLSRLNAGASLIDSHRTYDGVGSILGVVEKAWIADGQARARVRFSKRPDVEPVWQDVLDGIVRNVSMGTYVLEAEEVTKTGAEMKRFRATSWEPYEISLVSVPADAGAQVLEAKDAEKRPCRIAFSASASADATGAGAPKGESMKIKVRLLANDEIVEIDERDFDEKLHTEELEVEPTDTELGKRSPRRAAAPKDDPKATKLAVDEALEREAARASEIKRIALAYGLDTAWATRHVQMNSTVEAAIEDAADERKNRAPKIVSINASGGGGEDSSAPSWRAEKMAEALAARATRREIPEGARQYAHSTMVDMAFECLSWHGRERGLHPRYNASRVIELALTTSDYPNLLANAANKMLLPDYEAANPTYRMLAERQDLPDFKTASVLKAGDFPVPLQVAEEGEIKLGSFSEAKDSYALATYGRRLLFSFQAIVNDDLGAFSRIMRSAAVRLADFENSLWFTLLTSASGVGPTLGDAVALFNAASHGNYTSSGTAISVDSLGVGRALMKKQTSLDGIKLNITPKYLLTSPDKETLARQYTTVIGANVAPGSQNPWAGMLEPISDANLSTANPWYLFADPMRAPVSVYGYLQGQAGPSVATRQGFEVLGVEMRVALYFGTAFIDYRGAYRNAGA